MINKKIKRVFFVIAAVLILAPWPVSYAYAYTGDMARYDAVQRAVAVSTPEESSSISAQPIMSPTSR